MGLRIMWGRPLAAACAAAVVLLSAVLLATAVPCGDLDRGQCMEMNATCVHCLSPEGCVARGSGDCDPDAVLDACFDCFAQYGEDNFAGCQADPRCGWCPLVGCLGGDATGPAETAFEAVCNGTYRYSCGDGVVDPGEECDDPASTCCTAQCNFVPDGTGCNDGDMCTASDSCSAGVCTSAMPYTCDAECMTECDGMGGCVQQPSTCIIGPSCYPTFGPGSINPANQCEACTAGNPGDWSPLAGGSCSDGDSCTTGDSCAAGTCTGTPYACDACSVCDGAGGCDLPPGQCLIGGACYTNGQNKPGDICRECDTAFSTTSWKVLSGGSCDVMCMGTGPCDDTDECTSGDTCTLGACVGDAFSCPSCSTCDGNGGCTPNGGYCLISGVCRAAGTDNPSNQCQVCDPGESATEWSPKTSGTSCDDQNACTATSTCDNSMCVPGLQPSCDCHESGCDPGTGSCGPLLAGYTSSCTCTLGYYYYSPTQTCRRCLAGSYKDYVGNGPCSSCGPGMTSFPGATSIDDCFEDCAMTLCD